MFTRKLNVRLFAVLLSAGWLLVACGGTPATTPTAAPANLEGTRWMLAELNGAPPLENTQVTLEFSEGTAGGSAGCNDYGGDFEIDGGNIRIPELIRTEKFCMEPEGIMEQEDAYLQALQSGAGYTMSGDRLEIQNAAGETVLVFTSQG